MNSTALQSLFVRGARQATDPRRSVSSSQPSPSSQHHFEHLAALVEASAQGDQDAFAQLYGATSAKLYGFALRILKNEGLAQECLQDAYIRIWEHSGSYRRTRGAPLTWMGIIVRRRALDMIRCANREHVLDDPEELFRHKDQMDHAEGPESGLDFSERERLAACLGKLGRNQQQVLRLAFFDGLAYPEVAEHLQAPLGTVKTWIRGGMEKLRKCLEA
ncbi:sigma-70 family RNA polymerase sigma factor [Thiohalorhabdus methylotrophus]|uniref:Sigma-70 family RNA polymerase sigma factor n=1 Tax=Thiohalorhabdus methylotrophus TaxID=3242694 RepID=A0ABV4TY82_9GAMM